MKYCCRRSAALNIVFIVHCICRYSLKVRTKISRIKDNYYRNVFRDNVQLDDVFLALRLFQLIIKQRTEVLKFPRVQILIDS